MRGWSSSQSLGPNRIPWYACGSRDSLSHIFEFPRNDSSVLALASQRGAIERFAAVLRSSQAKTLCDLWHSLQMPKEPVSVEIIQEGDQRLMLKTFADGTEKHVPIVKLPRKRPRYTYRKWSFDKSKKKGF
jgi:hypothetical protein